MNSRPGGPNYLMASLYVGNLHPDVTESVLFEKFSKAGSVLSIRVCRDMVTRRSLGYAYVNFQQPMEAERALDTMNFQMLKQKPMRIMWSQRDPSLRKSGVGNVFVKNLDKSIDNKAMHDIFSSYGNILTCKESNFCSLCVISYMKMLLFCSVQVAQDENGNSKGYGFVHFETEKAANKAIEKVNETWLKGKKVFVGRFVSHKERFANVFVKNLPEDFTDEKLHELFKPYGNITSHKVMLEEGRSKGFGFVRFSSSEEATKAITEMNNRLVGIKRLYVALAQRKEDRKALLTSQHMQRKANLRMQRMGKIFPTANAGGYFLPMLQPQSQLFFIPSRMVQKRPQPRWLAQTQVNPSAQASGT